MCTATTGRFAGAAAVIVVGNGTGVVRKDNIEWRKVNCVILTSYVNEPSIVACHYLIAVV